MQHSGPKFLGRGWAFPVRFDLDTDPLSTHAGQVGSVAMVADFDDIRESLAVLISTARGERIMRPRYGVGLFGHVFDPMDETSLGDLRSQIEDAILFYEPRIKIEEIDIDTEQALDGVLMIRLTYWVPAVNSRSNMVYPFYVNEGTNLNPHDSDMVGPA